LESKLANQHKNKIQAVMIGLGGAFPVFAESHKRAPYWIRHLGCEWLYRLIQEPLRLFSRYSTTIPTFMWLALKQILDLALSRFTRHLP
jgi:N-acetylglucosaminyldiphosphoundecaprenol N-acetyl-beta-D-mannosaminyltransferase